MQLWIGLAALFLSSLIANVSPAKSRMDARSRAKSVGLIRNLDLLPNLMTGDNVQEDDEEKEENNLLKYSVNGQLYSFPSIIHLVKREIDRECASAAIIERTWLSSWKSKIVFARREGEIIELAFFPISGDPAKEYDTCMVSSFNFKTLKSNIAHLMTQKMSGSDRFFSCPQGHLL
jgi:hypothetical protein